MPTTTYGGKGTVLQVAFTAGNFTSIGQITEITGPNVTMKTREVTHLDSVADEFRAALSNGGEVSGTLEYDPAVSGHTTLANLMVTPSTVNSGGYLNCKIILAGSAKVFTFDAVPSKFSVKGMTPDGTVMADFGLTVTGAVTFPS